MVNIPVYCAKCDKWIESGISAEAAQSIQIGGGMSYKCPYCRTNVPYIQGDYRIMDGALEVVKSSDLTAEELKALTQILQQAIERNTPAGQVREIIAREIPKAAGLNKLLTDRAGLYALLMLILAIAQNITPFITPTNNNKAETERTVKAKAELKAKATPEAKKKTKNGVNDPCWCGSGKKRKRCHSSNSRPDVPSNLNQKPK